MAADRIEAFTVTIPANTAKSSPVNLPVTFDQGTVEQIDIDIPPGSSGLMGFQIAYGDQPIIPHDPSQYILRDNTEFRWPVENYPQGSGWAVIGYNTDIYDHDINLIFLINDGGIGASVVASVPIATPSAEIVISSNPPSPVTS